MSHLIPIAPRPGPEQNATTPAQPDSAAAASTPLSKQRSCVVCRSRKVRCDKSQPSCSNCCRANIPCIYPAKDRPPRWARRLERIVNNSTNAAAVPQPDAAPNAAPVVDQVMQRLRSLEGLVKELTEQLEEAKAAAGPASSTISPSLGSSNDQVRSAAVSLGGESGTGADDMQRHFGRLVLGDAEPARYVGSGFWSWIIDEVDGLKKETQSLVVEDPESSGDDFSPGKTESSTDFERTPSNRHAFLFGHNLRNETIASQTLHPLPSQIPYILDIFANNVNVFSQTVHMATVTKTVRGPRGIDVMKLKPADEALLFTLYSAATTSLEEEEVMTNFNVTKSELDFKYRMGFEMALAKADFMNFPDLTLVQALVIYLTVANAGEQDSTRFIWMMTGLTIRMAQALGLHRDGAQFPHLKPYEVEMRRRIWWQVCVLDIRAAEDQAIGLTIPNGSFDTKLPSNINDSQINPGSDVSPHDQEGATDMSIALMSFQMCEVIRKITALAAGEDGKNLPKQEELIDELYQTLSKGHVRALAESNGVLHRVGEYVARVAMAKMTLLIHLPTLFSSPSDYFCQEIRDKLFITSIELAEYNHALNAEEAYRGWRWIYRSYTHWHAIIYLLLEISRRPLSVTVERAWVALHSAWLIPPNLSADKNVQVWMPLRRLMAKARRHRSAEIARLQSDPRARHQAEVEDRKLPSVRSPAISALGSNGDELLVAQWQQLVGISHNEVPNDLSRDWSNLSSANSFGAPAAATHSTNVSKPHEIAQPTYLDAAGFQSPINAMANKLPDQMSTLYPTSHPAASGPVLEQSGDGFGSVPIDWSHSQAVDPSLANWLWTDLESSFDASAHVNAMDFNMDWDNDVDWLNWVESTKGTQWTSGVNAD